MIHINNNKKTMPILKEYLIDLLNSVPEHTLILIEDEQHNLYTCQANVKTVILNPNNKVFEEDWGQSPFSLRHKAIVFYKKNE